MQVAEALALIEKIIEEHRIILGGIHELDVRANDVAAMKGLGQAQEDFTPGRLHHQREALQKWSETLASIDAGIRAHFNREETALVAAIAEYGDEDLASTLQHWLAEHAELRQRLDKMKADIDNLTVAESYHGVWQEKAWGIRLYMNHTGKTFDVHARGEQKMLVKLRGFLQGKAEKKT